MAERFKAPVSKAGGLERAPGVRIPLLPPLSKTARMQSSIGLHEAEEDDIVEIKKITNSARNRKAFGFIMRPVLLAAIHERRKNGKASRQLLIVARTRGKVAGFFRLYHRRDGISTLHEIGVREDLQRRGIGEKMLRRAIKESRAFGQHTIRLSTTRDSAANGYYPRFGFVISGTARGRVRELNIHSLSLDKE